MSVTIISWQASDLRSEPKVIHFFPLLTWNPDCRCRSAPSGR